MIHLFVIILIFLLGCDSSSKKSEKVYIKNTEAETEFSIFREGDVEGRGRSSGKGT